MRLCGLPSLLWIFQWIWGSHSTPRPSGFGHAGPIIPVELTAKAEHRGWLLLVFVVQFSLRKTEQNPEESRLCSCFSPPARGQSPPHCCTLHRATPRWPAGFPVLVRACQFGLRLNSFIHSFRAPPHCALHHATPRWSMAGRFSGAGGRLPIRHGVGGFTTKFIHSGQSPPRFCGICNHKAPPQPCALTTMKRARARVLRTPRACGKFSGPRMWPWFTTEML